VGEVLIIRLMRNGNEDIVAWFYEKSGIFTVKSPYRLVVSEDLPTAPPDQGAWGVTLSST
jgi:hypothetical protein